MSSAVRRAASLVACSVVFVASAAFAQPTGAPAPAPAAPAAPVAVRAAVIDVQKVLRETEEGLRVEANLRKLFDSKQADLLAKEKQLAAEYEDLQKDQKAAKGKADAALEKRANDFKQKYNAYNTGAQEFQREFARKQNELYGPMIQKVNGIVKKLAQADGYDLVVEKQAAIYFAAQLEITERVITAYNAGDPGAKDEPKAPKAKAPAPAAPAKPKKQ